MAATPTPAARRNVHVHGGEVSTDRDSILGYAEALALVLALAASLVAAWISAAPGQGADLLKPDTDGPTGRAGQVELLSFTEPGTTNVLQPIPGGIDETVAAGIQNGAAEQQVAATRVAARRAAAAQAAADRAAATAQAAQAARFSDGRSFVDQFGER